MTTASFCPSFTSSSNGSFLSKPLASTFSVSVFTSPMQHPNTLTDCLKKFSIGDISNIKSLTSSMDKYIQSISKQTGLDNIGFNADGWMGSMDKNIVPGGPSINF